MTTAEFTRLSVFPLSGALLFPRSYLPLHIFEPRYRAMVADALARDRQIAMIQPRSAASVPELFRVGCVGRIAHVEALEDGRYNIVLEGRTRFRLVEEIEVTTPFRQVRAEIGGFGDEADPAPLPSIVRAELERECKRFADLRGIAVDWPAVERLDDESFVNGTAQVAPFDPATKQALLEALTIADRTELLIQFLQFARLSDDDDEIRLQ
jgi:Lon protease-like protein